MSKVAAIVTSMYEDVELTSPKKALEDAGNQVDIIENEANGTIEGKHGDKQTVNKSIDDAKLEDYDALLVPGGFSPDQLRADDRYINFAKQFLLSGKPVFAICHGPQLFIQTGLVSELTLTSYVTVMPDLYYAGGNVKDEPVVIDEKHNLITSRTPDDLDYFNKAIVDALK
ncbi:type 1 glutamine amidotransferase (plasmid) [Nicoliella spurrieriana]|uniref:Type 1 glutamine amidotransferase n=1 Tax=Nicoliella spurrieriana TaxID=2925830 RepID=A0A976RQL8_9LACO|nr:type 1 glutamine amidotransferase domain-containing protein [Nicoliella spurrieriana]UQS86060.1 type 1 glutamine amidotransferase [Nicoliella spurrieriana]